MADGTMSKATISVFLHMSPNLPGPVSLVSLSLFHLLFCKHRCSSFFVVVFSLLSRRGVIFSHPE